MMKPIYFSDRERELAIRICDYVAQELEEEGGTIRPLRKLACEWMREDVLRLQDKFSVVKP